MLSPDSVITHGDWLDELLNHAQRPEVGVVGAKLVNPQGRIECRPWCWGCSGPVGVPFRGERDAAGYMQRQQAVQNLSAVRAECLLVRKQVFDSFGGLTSRPFPKDSVRPTSVCVSGKGYLVVWTPYAEWRSARPAERTSGRAGAAALEQETFYQRWLPIIARDPAYNPNLSLNPPFQFQSGTGLADRLESVLPPHAAAGSGDTDQRDGRRALPGHPAVSRAGGGGPGQRAVSTTILPSIIELERQSPDVIILQGRYSRGAVNEIERVKNYSNALRIFELDDYVIDVPNKNAHVRNMPDNVEMERWFGVRSGCVTGWWCRPSRWPMRLSAMHDDIRVVPNMLAPHLWTGLSSQRRTSRKPRVGWGGGTSHDGDLAIIADVVRELADEVDWVFFGMCPRALTPLRA